MDKVRILLLVLVFNISIRSLQAQQKDTLAIMELGDKVMNNAEALGDSVLWYANSIEKQSVAQNYITGQGTAIRLRGLVYEIRGMYDSAMYYYREMEQFGLKNYWPRTYIGAMMSQFSVLLTLKQYDLGLQKALAAAALSAKFGFAKLESVSYSNAGIVYRRQNKYDSALACYKKAGDIRRQMGDSSGIVSININLGSLLVYMKKYDEALQYMHQNMEFHRRRGDTADLWFDYTNTGSAYAEKGDYNRAHPYLDSALNLARNLHSPGREAETLKILAHFYELQGKWQTAFNFLAQGTSLEAETVNEETRLAITEAEEKFKSKEKEKQNQLLQAEISNQQLRQRNSMIALGALAILALVIGLAWRQNVRKGRLLEAQNKLITSQNDQLIALNSDKNQLISMVSHDLSHPFNQLQVWLEVLKKRSNNQQGLEEPLDHLTKSVDYGRQLIRNVLDVERAGANRKDLNIISVGADTFLNSLRDDFTPAANGKGIRISVESSGNASLDTDEDHLRQIMENLVSNALKFSHAGSAVYLKAGKSDGQFFITVKDEGPGIPEEEQALLFNKYAIASPRPTGYELSTGLGLSIVKRLMFELGGTVQVKSKTGEGTAITLLFPLAASA
jgi:signal transduction histidine kinase